METKKRFAAETILIGLLFVLALAVTMIALTPAMRQGLRDFFSSDQRKVLAKVSGDLTGQGMLVTVLKIQENNQLILEIYSLENPEMSTQLARIVLPEKHDAYMQLKGNASNLILADVDKDGVLEIVAPTFDDQMSARLNVYKFSVETRTFQRMTPPAGTDL